MYFDITTPCTVNWNDMTPEGQGRYCGHCQKVVVDFCGMTDDEIKQYFHNLKYGTKVCGRMRKEQAKPKYVLNKRFMAFVARVTMGFAGVVVLLSSCIPGHRHRNPTMYFMGEVYYEPVAPVDSTQH